MTPVAGYITLVAVVAAGVSAVLWWRASAITLPPVTSEPFKGKGPFSAAMKRQSGLNSRAALAAAIAAGLQALSLFAQVLRW